MHSSLVSSDEYRLFALFGRPASDTVSMDIVYTSPRKSLPEV